MPKITDRQFILDTMEFAGDVMRTGVFDQTLDKPAKVAEAFYETCKKHLADNPDPLGVTKDAYHGRSLGR